MTDARDMLHMQEQFEAHLRERDFQDRNGRQFANGIAEYD